MELARSVDSKSLRGLLAPIPQGFLITTSLLDAMAWLADDLPLFVVGGWMLVVGVSSATLMEMFPASGEPVRHAQSSQLHFMRVCALWMGITVLWVDVWLHSMAHSAPQFAIACLSIAGTCVLAFTTRTDAPSTLTLRPHSLPPIPPASPTAR